MPAYLTHYTCGLMGYRSLPDGELKDIIREHASVYNMGLAGPDLFFYSPLELATEKQPVGRVMHKYRTGKFLQALYGEVQSLKTGRNRTDEAALYRPALPCDDGSDNGCDFISHVRLHDRSVIRKDNRIDHRLNNGNDIGSDDKKLFCSDRQTTVERTRDYATALAYFCGFVGHYCLDTRTHALVYKICDHPDSKVALGKHFRYEAAMDAMCCEKLLGRSICDSHQMELLKLSRRDRQVIARVLSGALRKVYGEEIRTPSYARVRAFLKEYYLLGGILVDPTGFKEWLAVNFECFIGLPGFPLASPLFINNNRYGLTDRDWERFYPHFRDGVKALGRALSLVEEGNMQSFWQEIGSWSYHGMHLTEGASDLPLRELTSL